MSVESEVYDAEDFLALIWGERKGWVDLPAKVGSYWVPFYCEWPADGIVTRRIDTSLRDREDLYYSVAQFAKRGRKEEDVLPTRWLWADLDEVHPTTAGRFGLHPTMAIESSVGRYQALWRLTRELHGDKLAKINRGLSYALDADKGGWDLTQVLRIPGTRNYKYVGNGGNGAGVGDGQGFVVRLLWYESELEYEPSYVWEKVREHVPKVELARAVSETIERRSLTGRTKALLRTKPEEVVEGERSARLWELECLLAEAGLDEDEIWGLVKGSAWNKWPDRDRRLMEDVRKAVRHVRRKAALADSTSSGGSLEPDDEGATEVTPESESNVSGSFPWVGYSSFLAMRMEQPKWMVEGIWTAGSHGIIGGEPKTSKTTIALGLGLSVASGMPFLGEYAVHTSGPVLFVQEENAPWMIQDRLRKLAAFYGLLSQKETHVSKAGRGALGKVNVEVDFPEELPLKVLNNFGFDLSVEEHRDLLVAEVDALRPALIILDPLYLMVGSSNYDKATEMVPFLKWLMHLRYKFNCAIAIIHHFGKQQNGPGVGVARRSGQRVLGSMIFHGWVDSAIYAHAIESDRDGWTRTKLETEFRSMAPRKPIELDIRLGAPGGLEMEAELRTRTLEQEILDIVRVEPGVTVIQLAEKIGVDKRTVLSRIRGNSQFEVVEGKRGRGQSTTVSLTGEKDDVDAP